MVASVNVEEIEAIIFQTAKILTEINEELPPFSTRYPDKLESCLEQPFQAFGNTEFYPTLFKKSAILFYLLIKNHPFRNGNKRIAVFTVIYFLYKNKLLINVKTGHLYTLAIFVAESDLSEKEEVLGKLEEIFIESTEVTK